MSHVVRPSGRRSTLPRIATEVLLAGVVTVAGAAFVPVPAAAALPDVTAAVSASPTEAPDEATAMHLAWKTRKPVEIAGERTESSETFAQPDGTLRTREYATPFRVRRGSGWVPVNTDLKVADGVVVPEAATLDVRFSAGGAGPMLTVVKDGRSPAGFTVAAWVRLPAPEPADGGEEPGEQPGEGTEPGAGEGDDPEGGGTPSDEEQGEETSSLPTSNQVAVSQDGRNASMFRLGYRADLDLDGDAVKDPAWCFTVKAQDLSTAGSIDACTTSYVEAGAWVHLVGIVNPVTNRIQLYVNGIPARDGVFSNRRT